MAEKDNKKSTDTSIPPPPDPFPTYQTPYPRSNKDDENPFIQFRRFADEQLSSFFQGIPQLFGFSSSRDTWKKDFDDLIRRSNELEEGWRKQFEQEMEEMKQEFERSRTEAWKALEDAGKAPKDNTAWWARETGVNGPALNGKGSESAKKCPALYDEDGQPKTELDAYDGQQGTDAAVEIPVIKSSSRHTSDKASDSWFSSFGWDGKQREQENVAATERTISYGSWSEERQVASPTTYTLFAARRMNPFDNADHTIPWLLLSPYSPIYLSNPSQSRLFKVRIQDCEGEPFQISRPRFFERWYTDIDEKMADQIPWADAFEDLLSLQQTGKMVERDSPTWRTPTDWIHGLVHRGSLGPAWGFNRDGLLVKHFTEPKSADARSVANEKCGWRRGRGLVRGNEIDEANPSKKGTATEIAADNEGILDDLVDKAAERLGPFPLFGSIISAADSIVSAVDQATQDMEAVSKESKEETQAESESSETEEPTDTPYTTLASPPRQEQPIPSRSLISTLTTTVTRTLPDGSVETRRVLKRRFADGTEESNESVEVKNPLSATQTMDAETKADKQTQTLPATGQHSQPQEERPSTSSVQDALIQQRDTRSEQDEKRDDGNRRSSGRGGWFWT